MSRESTRELLPEQELSAERMRRLRSAVAGDGVTYFAETLLGLSYKQWKNFENGYLPPRDVVTKICQTFPGVSSDWVMFGKVETLSFPMQVKLGYVEPPPDAA